MKLHLALMKMAIVGEWWVKVSSKSAFIKFTYMQLKEAINNNVKDKRKMLLSCLY